MKPSKNSIYSYLLFFAIGLSTFSVHLKLDDIHTMIVERDVPKITISDNAQFAKLCVQLSDQWGANGYAFYILQPKGSLKTYKEQASASVDYQYLPIRTDINRTHYQNQLKKDRYVILERSEIAYILPGASDESAEDILIIGIYKHNTIVGELYLFYDKNIDRNSINNLMSEAQVFSELLY